jgi:hypothetical protein
MMTTEKNRKPKKTRSKGVPLVLDRATIRAVATAVLADGSTPAVRHAAAAIRAMALAAEAGMLRSVGYSKRQRDGYRTRYHRASTILLAGGDSDLARRQLIREALSIAAGEPLDAQPRTSERRRGHRGAVELAVGYTDERDRALARRMRRPLARALLRKALADEDGATDAFADLCEHLGVGATDANLRRLPDTAVVGFDGAALRKKILQQAADTKPLVPR